MNFLQSPKHVQILLVHAVMSQKDTGVLLLQSLHIFRNHDLIILLRNITGVADNSTSIKVFFM